ncbi:PE family protein [Mycobacterium sp. TY814]|uniref:PE family protein n=1 Tax=unclassified Mycobacterium TaxID=2642494 RepID=UPI003532005A
MSHAFCQRAPRIRGSGDQFVDRCHRCHGRTLHVRVRSAAVDEVSVPVAALSGGHGVQYQLVSAPVRACSTSSWPR